MAAARHCDHTCVLSSPHNLKSQISLSLHAGVLQLHQLASKDTCGEPCPLQADFPQHNRNCDVMAGRTITVSDSRAQEGEQGSICPLSYVPMHRDR